MEADGIHISLMSGGNVDKGAGSTLYVKDVTSVLRKQVEFS